eukprot:scaffold46632_cov67-Attheya_sp.AAC.2
MPGRISSIGWAKVGQGWWWRHMANGMCVTPLGRFWWIWKGTGGGWLHPLFIAGGIVCADPSFFSKFEIFSNFFFSKSNKAMKWQFKLVIASKTGASMVQASIYGGGNYN